MHGKKLTKMKMAINGMLFLIEFHVVCVAGTTAAQSYSNQTSDTIRLKIICFSVRFMINFFFLAMVSNSINNLHTVATYMESGAFK